MVMFPVKVPYAYRKHWLELSRLVRSHGMVVVEMDSVGGRGSVLGNPVVMEVVEDDRKGWLVLSGAERDKLYV